MASQGQITYVGGAGLFLLFTAVAAYMIHVRAKVDVKAVERWGEAKKSKVRKGASGAAKFFVNWVCVEAGLEVVVEILNYLASASVVASAGPNGSVDASPVPFFFAFGLNILMIVLESIEVSRTRKHGGKQTPWDRFWFGQWKDDTTRKNYYAKYSARMTLGFHFVINVLAWPQVTGMAEGLQMDPGAVGSGSWHDYNNRLGRTAMFLSSLNTLKLEMGVFTLIETTGMTLLSPLLAALPKPLQRVRIGPLADTEMYSRRDFVITSFLSWWWAWIYYNVNYKFVAVCGWSPDAWPWNFEGYPGENTWGGVEPEIIFDDVTGDPIVPVGGISCDNYPRMFLEIAFTDGVSDDRKWLFWVLNVFSVLVIPLILFYLYRKLPTWGEPPAGSGTAQTKDEEATDASSFKSGGTGGDETPASGSFSTAAAGTIDAVKDTVKDEVKGAVKVAVMDAVKGAVKV